MRFVILTVQGLRTGGPEACYQLTDMLLRCGFDAELWLITPGDHQLIEHSIANGVSVARTSLDVPQRLDSIADYSHYQVRPFTGCYQGEDVTFVVPEIYAWTVPFFAGANVLVWWLSVDNAFGALSNVNLNWLRTPTVRHAVQSEYAARFTRALGFESTPLGDYTVVTAGHDAPVATRPWRVALAAGKKVIFDLDALVGQIVQACPQAEVIRISGMTRDQVYDVFRSARVFIDIGQFPGKDRMAREALLLGANVILGNSGSGMNEDDYAIASLYRPPACDLERVAHLAAHMLANPAAHAPQFGAARAVVAREREDFSRQVLETFGTYR